MYIKVIVTPGAKKERLSEERGNSFSISVRAPAQRNLANRRVCELLAHHFGVSMKRVKILTGHHSPGKMISIET